MQTTLIPEPTGPPETGVFLLQFRLKNSHVLLLKTVKNLKMALLVQVKTNKSVTRYDVC